MALSRGSLLALGLRSDRRIGSTRVDIFTLIRELGLRLHMAPAGRGRQDLEGMYLRKGGVGFVFVNAAKPPRRQRLTAAHELGHHFLLGDDDQEVEHADWNGDTEQAEEREAYAFARELLMDRHWLKANCANLPLEEAIEQTVSRFAVSPEAAAVRLCELGLITPEQKGQVLAQQQDETTRRWYGRAGQPSDLIDYEPMFLRRVSRLAAQGILSEPREQELIDHADPLKYHRQ